MMPEPIQIDDSEKNTDWIKTPENRKPTGSRRLKTGSLRPRSIVA